MPIYFVTGVWKVEAKTADEAENYIENAVSQSAGLADLEECHAELEDGGYDLTDAELEDLLDAKDDQPF